LRKPTKSPTLAELRANVKPLRAFPEATLLSLPKISDKRGNLSVIEQNKHIPFDIKRVFYLYDIATGESRGGHAHKECHQFLIALNGSFDVRVKNGSGYHPNNGKTITLNQPHQGLHIPPMVWAEEINFSQGAICLVLASLPYDESDYIRSYSDFLKEML
jgi:dTDP-4-dehydrorhamnose 3,5-epimerase-like enzyme